MPWLLVQRINSSSVSGTETLIKLHTLPPMKTLAATRQNGAKAYRPFCKSCSKYWTLKSITCIYSCTVVYPGCQTVFCQTTKVHKCWYYGIKTTRFHILLHILTHSGIHLNLHSTTSFLAKCEKLCCTYEKYD